jgi:hypothetical protein
MKKIAVLLLVFGLALTACKKKKDPVPENPFGVQYSIVCTDCAVLYYYDEIGNDTMEFHKDSNWKYGFTGKKGQRLFLFAYNTSETPQDVTATILLNDTILERKTTYCPVNGSVLCADTIP